MKLGIQIEWAGRNLEIPVERVRKVEALGYDSVWSAEAYGSDAITPLAFLAAHTERIRLGTCVIQVDARSPASTAMSIATLDAISGGRAICGLGVEDLSDGPGGGGDGADDAVVGGVRVVGGAEEARKLCVGGLE